MIIKQYYVTLQIASLPLLCLYLHWCHVCSDSSQINAAFSLASILTWYHSRVWGCRNCWVTILPDLTCPEGSVVEYDPNLLCYAVRLSSPEVFATLIILYVWNSITDSSFLTMSCLFLLWAETMLRNWTALNVPFSPHLPVIQCRREFTQLVSMRMHQHFIL